MKKFTLKNFALTFALAASTAAGAQVVFSEDFDGVPGSTAGGAGTYAFPTGWTLANVDNRTPDPGVAYVNDAWERREDFNFNVADSAAFSTSWYSPTGAADDWMWTPAISSLPANCVLTWNAVTYDASFQDGYEVRIMTVAPTGSTGNLGNMVSASTVLFSTGAEASTWTSHNVSLSAYAGQTVYIGFRNNSNDKFLLLVDDVSVQVQVNNDAAITAIDTATEYTLTPLAQVQPLNLAATVMNNGLNALSNVMLNVTIFDGGNNVVYNQNSTAIASLAPSATANLNVAGYTPNAVDVYTIRYYVTSAAADQVPANDTVYSFAIVTDSTYGRDDGTVTGALGIGAGNGGYLGEDFQIVNNTSMTSVSFFVTQGYTGRKFAAVIWDMPSGTPGAIIGGTDTLLYPDDSARFYTVNIHGGPLSLVPGQYAVTMVEFDSTLQIGLTSSLFTAGSTWVNWPTNPFGTWAHNEAFGASFAKSYVIRPNFGSVSTGVEAVHGVQSVLAYPNPASGMLYYDVALDQQQDMTITFRNMLGETIYTENQSGDHYTSSINIEGLPAGIYFLEVKTATSSKVVKVVVQ